MIGRLWAHVDSGVNAGIGKNGTSRGGLGMCPAVSPETYLSVVARARATPSRMRRFESPSRSAIISTDDPCRTSQSQVYSRAAVSRVRASALYEDSLRAKTTHRALFMRFPSVVSQVC
jgi:hypothetical protein